MRKVDLTSLRDILIRIHLIHSSYQLCIDWAYSELERGVEDEDICVLAGSNINNMDEVTTYLRKILGKDILFTKEELEEAAGRIILDIGQQYFADKIDIVSIEDTIDRLYVNLNYTDWLVMLARNSEYATDIDCFIIPFESELRYIIDLWTQFPQYEQFIQHYSRDISNLHA